MSSTLSESEVDIETFLTDIDDSEHTLESINRSFKEYKRLKLKLDLHQICEKMFTCIDFSTIKSEFGDTLYTIRRKQSYTNELLDALFDTSTPQIRKTQSQDIKREIDAFFGVIDSKLNTRSFEEQISYTSLTLIERTLVIEHLLLFKQTYFYLDMDVFSKISNIISDLTSIFQHKDLLRGQFEVLTDNEITEFKVIV